MHSESSGNINYWPGFVDAFSNLVLALVFVIVILAMSLGLFSGLMAKMAIQRALIEQRLEESREAASLAGNGPGAPSIAAPSPAQVAQAAVPAAREEEAKGEKTKGEEAEIPETAQHHGETAAAEALAPAPGEPTAAAAPAGGVSIPVPDALRLENEALRQEIAALRKKNATLAQSAASSGGANTPTRPADAKPNDKFALSMPEGDRHFSQRIEADLQRALQQLQAQNGDAHIDVMIYVPNYALTENKRTALFYLISIKDYLMKQKVSPDRIRMHMVPAAAGQQEMTVSMSVEP